MKYTCSKYFFKVDNVQNKVLHFTLVTKMLIFDSDAHSDICWKFSKHSTENLTCTSWSRVVNNKQSSYTSKSYPLKPKRYGGHNCSPRIWSKLCYVKTFGW